METLPVVQKIVAAILVELADRAVFDDW